VGEAEAKPQRDGESVEKEKQATKETAPREGTFEENLREKALIEKNSGKKHNGKRAQEAGSGEDAQTKWWESTGGDF